MYTCIRFCDNKFDVRMLLVKYLSSFSDTFPAYERIGKSSV